jgi:hypothetical protein
VAQICGILFRFFLKNIPQFCARPAEPHGRHQVVTFRTGLGRAVSASVMTTRPSAGPTGAARERLSVGPPCGRAVHLVGGAAAAGVVVLARICGILFRFFLK